MERLRELRLELGLKQKDIAEVIGVDRTTYVKYETGSSEPNVDIIKKLATFFKTTTDYILGKSDIRSLPDEIAEMPAAFHNGAFDGLDKDDLDFLSTVADGLREKKKKREGV